MNSYPLHAVIYFPETHVCKKLMLQFQELLCMHNICMQEWKQRHITKEGV